MQSITVWLVVIGCMRCSVRCDSFMQNTTDAGMHSYAVRIQWNRIIGSNNLVFSDKCGINAGNAFFANRSNISDKSKHNRRTIRGELVQFHLNWYPNDGIQPLFIEFSISNCVQSISTPVKLTLTSFTSYNTVFYPLVCSHFVFSYTVFVFLLFFPP